MVDVNALKAAWVKKGMTQADVAKGIGMTERTLSNRLKKGVFGTDEIEALVILLDIENPIAIFFANTVTCKVAARSA